MSAALYF